MMLCLPRYLTSHWCLAFAERSVSGEYSQARNEKVQQSEKRRSATKTSIKDDAMNTPVKYTSASAPRQYKHVSE